MFKTSVGIERNRSMVKQITIAHHVHSAIGKEAAHVLFQFLAVDKRGVYLVYNLLLFVREPVRVGRVYRREVGVAQRVFLALAYQHSALPVYPVQ